MFYSELVLAKKGPLGRIWLAAHWDRKLTKQQILQADLPRAVGIARETLSTSHEKQGI